MTPAELVEGLYADCLNKRQLDRLDEYLAPGFVGANGENGPEGFRRTIERMVTAFPDLQFEIEDLFAADDKVCLRWRFRAAQLGPLANVAATGKMAVQEGIAIYHASDGKLSRAWLQVDRLGVLQQIGAVTL